MSIPLDYPLWMIAAATFAYLPLNIWVTVRGANRIKNEDRVPAAIIGIAITWLVGCIGWIPGLILTAPPKN